MMTHKAITIVAGFLSSIGLFATEEVIPGWSDIGSLAKVSVLAALFAILSMVISYVIYSLFTNMRQLQKDHMSELNNSRAALMGEIKDSRDAFGKVITVIRESAERQSERSNVVLHELDQTVRAISAGCAATQEKVKADAEAARRDLLDRAQTARSELRGRADTAKTIVHDAEDAARSVLHLEADTAHQRLAGESGISSK